MLLFSNILSRVSAISLAISLCVVACGKTPDPDPDTNPSGGNTEQSVADTLSFRLMQFNILQGGKADGTTDQAGHEWSSVRKAPCIAVIKEANPDIMCLQECRREQLNDLRQNLSLYTWFMYAKDGEIATGYSEGDATNDASFKNSGHRDVIAVNYRKFKLLDWGRYWFSTTPDKSTYSWDAGTPKLTLWVKLESKEYGNTFYVWCTHFFPSGDEGKKQCGIMSANRMKEICGDNATVFFCGDLNLVQSNAALAPLNTWMKNARSAAPDTDKSPTYTGFRTNSTTWTQIDHIYFRNAEALKYKVITEPQSGGTSVVSDHFPTYADFRIILPKE